VSELYTGARGCNPHCGERILEQYTTVRNPPLVNRGRGGEQRSHAVLKFGAGTADVAGGVEGGTQDASGRGSRRRGGPLMTDWRTELGEFVYLAGRGQHQRKAHD
jgi:hypothetical protein